MKLTRKQAIRSMMGVMAGMFGSVAMVHSQSSTEGSSLAGALRKTEQRVIGW